eukprot:193501-Rhodomonas_salina.1
MPHKHHPTLSRRARSTLQSSASSKEKARLTGLEHDRSRAFKPHTRVAKSKCNPCAQNPKLGHVHGPFLRQRTQNSYSVPVEVGRASELREAAVPRDCTARAGSAGLRV